MKFVQITPGAGGGFYCENCLRDAGLVRELRRRGHEAMMVPLYLPPVADGPAPPQEAPIFFGGINVYLQQKSAVFRHTPRWLDRLLDARPLLRWVARRAGMTDAADLGPPTLSMLRGEGGRQVKELRRLVSWLRDRGRPDALCLSNALLLGLAPRLKEALGSPILCTLQDEDAFLDGLPEPYRAEAWDRLGTLAREVDAYLPVSHYYAGVMGERLSLPADRVHVVPPGIDPDAYEPAGAPPTAPAIGYLAQQNRAGGLDRLVEAYLEIRRRGRVAGLRLRIAGGRTRGDAPFLADLRHRIQRSGAGGEVEFLPVPDRDAKRAMLRSVSVLSVPARGGPASALYVLEAAASGVPVVEPRAGALPELVEATGGGVLVEPGDPAALADAMEGLLLDPDRARALGQAGRRAVLERFTIRHMAERVLGVIHAVRCNGTIRPSARTG